MGKLEESIVSRPTSDSVSQRLEGWGLVIYGKESLAVTLIN